LRGEGEWGGAVGERGSLPTTKEGEGGKGKKKGNEFLGLYCGSPSGKRKRSGVFFRRKSPPRTNGTDSEEKKRNSGASPVFYEGGINLPRMRSTL